MKKIFFIAAVLLLSQKFSQGSTDYGSGMKFNLNEDGSKYMRFIAWIKYGYVPVKWTQVQWLRGSGNNWNHIGNRRLRFLAYSNFLKIHDCYPLW
jgi:hypothetical protein